MSKTIFNNGDIFFSHRLPGIGYQKCAENAKLTETGKAEKSRGAEYKLRGQVTTIFVFCPGR